MVEPHDATDRHPGQDADDVPEGFDAQVAFGPRRARNPTAFLFPAVDPLRTTARCYPSQEHQLLVETARALLRAYDQTDPAFTLDVADGSGMTGAAQHLIRYLAQHLEVGRPFTSEPAEATSYSQLLHDVRETLEGAI